MIIKRIEPISAACCGGTVLFALGFVFAFLALIQQALLANPQMRLDGTFVLFLFLIAPLLYGMMGFVLGLLAALAFNWTADWYGGLHLEIEETRKYSARKSALKPEEKVIFIKEQE